MSQDNGGIRACPRCEYQPTEEELLDNDGYCPNCRHDPTGRIKWYDVACPRCQTGLGLEATWEEATNATEVLDGATCAVCGYDGELTISANGGKSDG